MSGTSQHDTVDRAETAAPPAEPGKRRRSGRRPLVIGFAFLGVVATSGVAYGYWTAGGSGTATGTTGTSANFTVTQDGSVSGLVPGGAAQDVNYTINNPRSSPQHATTVTIAITGVTYTAAAGSGVGVTWQNHPAGGPAPGCTAADFTLVQPDALGEDLAAGNTSFTRATVKKSGTIAMDNEVTNQDDCKGTTVALSITVA